MAFDKDLALRQLIKIYSDAYDDILNTIANKDMSDSVEQFQRSILADVDKKIRELNQVADKYSAEVIPEAYRTSRNEVLNIFDSNNIDYDIAANFGKVHQDAVEVLQQNFYDNMAEAHNFVGRQLRDKIRQAQLDVATKQVTTGQTIDEAKDNLIQKLSNEGITSYTDSAGRSWTLDRYAEMSARTVTAEATNKGTFNQLRSMDRDLVQLTSHASPCPICAPLEGRVYSLSGNSDRFPSIDFALPSRAGTVHPNCLHRFVPYVPELADDLERDKERSNRSFDEDPRSEKAKQAYKNQQKLNTYRRKVNRLTYRLKGLEEGTEAYKKAKSKLNNYTDTVRDLEDKVSATDAKLIDDIYRTV